MLRRFGSEGGFGGRFLGAATWGKVVSLLCIKVMVMANLKKIGHFSKGRRSLLSFQSCVIAAYDDFAYVVV